MSECHRCSRCPADPGGPKEPGRRAFVASALPALLAAAAVPAFAMEAFAASVVDAVPLPAGERAFPVPAGDGVLIDRETEIILVRRGRQVFAFARACPHEQAQLRWREADARFQCPRHESKYQIDGTLISGRATRNMDRLPVRREGETVVVDPSRPIRSDRQAADWAAAVVSL